MRDGKESADFSEAKNSSHGFYIVAKQPSDHCSSVPYHPHTKDRLGINMMYSIQAVYNVIQTNPRDGNSPILGLA
jgi:hypothetical protein